MARRQVIGVLLTGGTVASEVVPGDHERVVTLKTTDSAEARSEMGLLRAATPVGANIQFYTESPLSIASEGINPRHWDAIAQAVRKLSAHDLTGILILHGTDTMAYTAAALSFMLVDMAIPIVLTGSNLPPGVPGSDASKNVHDALVALSELDRGTYITFAGRSDLPGLIHTGTQVRKVHASRQAFYSVNRQPVGQIRGTSIEWCNQEKGGAPRASTEFHTLPVPAMIEPHVLMLRMYPGLDLQAMVSVVDAGGIRAVIIELYASATGPTSPEPYSVPSFVKQCTARGVAVFLTVFASPDGPPNVYESTVHIRDEGGIFLSGMIPETALVKAMWGLGRTIDRDSLVRLMLTPIAGELVETIKSKIAEITLPSDPAGNLVAAQAVRRAAAANLLDIRYSR